MEELKVFFNNKYEIQIAIVYGSFATGKVHSESNVDIAIACNEVLSSEVLMEYTQELSLIVKRPIDLVDLRIIHVPLLQEVLVKGVVLKNTNKELHIELIKKQIREATDFLPLKRKIQKIKLTRFLKNGQ